MENIIKYMEIYIKYMDTYLIIYVLLTFKDYLIILHKLPILYKTNKF